MHGNGNYCTQSNELKLLLILFTSIPRVNEEANQRDRIVYKSECFKISNESLTFQQNYRSEKMKSYPPRKN